MNKQQLQLQLKESILAQDELKKSVLRMLLSALNYYEINKGGAGYEATEEDVLSVIKKEAKQHRDSIEQFKNANRTDLVEKEEKELKMLEAYLPSQMSEDEIREIVKQTITETGISSVQEMGKLMGALMPKIKGEADGTLVSKIVKEELS